jgi:hypothetical protein
MTNWIASVCGDRPAAGLSSDFDTAKQQKDDAIRASVKYTIGFTVVLLVLGNKISYANVKSECKDVLAGKREESNRLPISERVSNGATVSRQAA